MKNKFFIAFLVAMLSLPNIAFAQELNSIPTNNQSSVETIQKSIIVPALNEYKDVTNNSKVTNVDQLKDLIISCSKTLQTELKVKIPNFNSSTYDLNNFSFYGLKAISYKGTSYGSQANLTISIEYQDDFKINQAVYSDIAKSRLDEKQKITFDKACSILNSIIKNEMTPYEKVLAVHDYLVLGTVYDYDNMIKNTVPEDSYSIYGTLVNKTAVCQGYANSTKLLLNLLGIECDVVSGYSKNQSHAWNIVKLDDEYYMLDVTWDDPVPDKEGYVRYAYFNVTSDELAKDHTWTVSDYPIATGTKNNYYVKNNLVVNSYDEFKSYVIDKIKKGEKDITVYIKGYNKDIYKLDFIHSYHNGTVSYSDVSNGDTEFTISLK